MKPLVLVLLSTFSMACASSLPSRGADVNDQARARYLVGMEELLSGNYTEAIQHFQQVSKNPGYVSYAALARLRIGDALFLQEKFDAAVELYRSFIKGFEGNPNTGYARFRIGHAFYEQIPAEWFLSPPVHERQQTHVVFAQRALRRFVELYPAHRLVPQAVKMLDDCEKKLYEHEIYVARFYRKRDEPAAVVQRLERAFRKFPELAGSEENYMILAQALARTKALDKAIAMYQAYIDRFPDGEYRRQAHESLRVLREVQEEERKG